MTDQVAYRPDGSFIAGVQKSKIILWEKNGLRHLEFETNNSSIEQLQFSQDSQILSFYDKT